MGEETILHSFAGSPDGENPDAALVRDGAGNLYGTTLDGGDSDCGGGLGCGIVFKLDKNGNETILHTFSGTDGEHPKAGLLRDAAGNLYGTTTFGGGTTGCGSEGCGVVFKITP